MNGNLKLHYIAIKNKTMQPVSVVVVCKNEAHTIADVVKSVLPLTDDIIVADNGSMDNTIDVANKARAKVITLEWKGFGPTKNAANNAAAYDWILSLDADEMVDTELLKQLNSLPLANINQVYELRFKNYLGDKLIKYGAWGTDKHVRIFNRKKVHWNEEYVHEELIFPPGIKKITLNGFVMHKTARTMQEFYSKMMIYADLNARRYFKNGKKGYLITLWANPVFDFVKNYIFRLGFLDGAEGFSIARIHAYYTYLKYAKLRNLYKNNNA